jgi:ribonuclease P protein component
MRAAAHRLRRRQEFTTTLRSGRRAVGRTPREAQPLLVLHLDVPGEVTPARVGYVVPRSVGTAVTRNLLRRRLRHLVAERVAALPAGSRLVVRVLPPAARATFGELAGALDRALERSLPARTDLA